jgi:hypothetical protein
MTFSLRKGHIQMVCADQPHAYQRHQENCFSQSYLQSIKVLDENVTIAVLVRLIYRPESISPEVVGALTKLMWPFVKKGTHRDGIRYCIASGKVLLEWIFHRFAPEPAWAARAFL